MNIQPNKSHISGKYFKISDDNITLKIPIKPSLEKTELETILDHEKSQGLIDKRREPHTLESAKFLSKLTQEAAIDSSIQLALKRLFIISRNLTEREIARIFIIFLGELSDPEQKTARKLKKHLRLSENNATNFIHIINAGAAICQSLKLLLSPPPSNNFFDQVLHLAVCMLYWGDQRPYREDKKTRTETSSLGGLARYETYYKPIKDKLTEQLQDLPLTEPHTASAAVELVLPKIQMSHEDKKRIMHAGSKRLLIKWTKEIRSKK